MRTGRHVAIVGIVILSTVTVVSAQEHDLISVQVRTDGDAAVDGLAVRSRDTGIRALVAQATVESATFQSMVETIRVSRGIVYVDPGDCRHGVRACLVHVIEAGTHRILFVKVRARTAERKLMASIGHELRHAIEVLGDPDVKTTTKMFFFFSRTATTRTPVSFETRAAIEAGDAVDAEIGAHRRRIGASQ